MNRLREKILQEILANGSISFARFMELALYEPGLGYYERQRNIGRSGDFFTSVSVSALFGELLAGQFARWLDRIPPPYRLVEAGAHQGDLSRDILQWFQRNEPGMLASLHYILIEPSLERR